VFWVYAGLLGDYLLKGILLTMRFRSVRWKTVFRTEDLGLQRA